LKIKVEGHHFDEIEVIEAESQAVLKPSKNTTLRMHYNLAEALGTAHASEAIYFEGDGGRYAPS
jgi:hypothetical protein